MYSVEDLLISHGYKPPRNARPSSSQGCPHEAIRSRSGSGSHGGVESHMEVAGKRVDGDWESKESSSRDVEHQSDVLTVRGRSCDGKHGMACQLRTKKDLNYWRRRGQDFSVLQSYADIQGRHGAECRGQPQGWDEAVWPRDRDGEGHEPQRAAADRKWQSLGTEEWRPAVGLGQQLSDGEPETWVRESTVLSRTKGTSKSLPRGPLSESLQAMPSLGTSSAQHVDATSFLEPYHKQRECASSEDLWADKHRSAVHTSVLPRFSRPIRVPSYEAHQQKRNSSETIAGDLGPPCRDRFICGPTAGELREDSFAYQSAGPGLGPPGYIPPPSYKRPMFQKRNQKNLNEVSNFHFKGDLQAGTWEAEKWYYRPVGGSWVDYQGHRSVPCQRLTNQRYLDQHPGCVQYLPFSDPRVRCISGGQCGNSLTDSDKMRCIHREIPRAKVLGQSIRESAFLLNEELIPNTNSKITNNENDNIRGCHGESHEGNGNAMTFDQNCNERHTEIQMTKYRQNGNADRGFPEMITQLKETSPDVEKTKPAKRKVNETIFCLVSVPVHMQPDRKDSDHGKLLDLAEQSNPITNDKNQSEKQILQSTSLKSLELQLPPNGVSNRTAAVKPCLKELVKTQSLQLSKPVGLRCSSSWPGDQYRDQETQTCSSEAPSGSSHSCLSLPRQDQGQPISDATVNNSLGTDNNSMYSFHGMKGQKILKPSNNSAFSKTSIYSRWSNKSTDPPGRPSGQQKERDGLLVRNIEGVPAICNGKEAFGQFLLKPVGRRPWDAIEELESFNKELQEQFSQQASIEKSVEDLNKACRDLQESSSISNSTGNDRMQLLKQEKENRSPSVESHCKSSKIQHTSRRWITLGNPEHREEKSAFSRAIAKAVSFSDYLQEGVPVQSDSENYSIPDQNFKKTETEWMVSKPGVPLRKQALHRSVGMTDQPFSDTKATELQLMQDASSLTSPLDCRDISHPLQMTGESDGWYCTVPVKSIPENTDQISPPSFCGDLSSDSKKESWFCRTETDIMMENSIPQVGGVMSSNVSKNHRLHGHRGPIWIVSKKQIEQKGSKGVNVTTGHSCDWRSRLSLAEKSLEILHIKEKTNSLPEDLSTLYEIKCAKGIPENESIEQRAARILGIEVPAESLCVVGQKGDREVTERRQAEKVVAVPNQENPETSGDENQNLLMKSDEMMGAPDNEEVRKVELTSPMGDDGLVGPTDRDNLENFLNLDPGLPDEPLGDEIEKCTAVCGNSESERDGSIQQESNSISMEPGMPQDECTTLSLQKTVEIVKMNRESQPRHLRSSESQEDVEDRRKSDQQSQLENSRQCHQQPRGGTVAKREITLPRDLCCNPDSLIQDMELLSFSDLYDPSHVEKV